MMVYSLHNLERRLCGIEYNKKRLKKDSFTFKMFPQSKHLIFVLENSLNEILLLTQI